MLALASKTPITFTPTFEYQLFVWRRAMSASWQDAMSTPIAVIWRDLEYIRIENTIKAGNQEQARANTGRSN